MSKRSSHLGGGRSVDRTGLSDASHYLQQLLSQNPPGETLYLDEGVYRLERSIGWNGKCIKVIGRGLVKFVQSNDLLTPMLSASNADGSVVSDIAFIGTDDQRRYLSMYKSLPKFGQEMTAVSILDSRSVALRKLQVGRKMTGVAVLGCEQSSVNDLSVIGFGKEILAEKLPAHRHIGLLLLQGEDNLVSNFDSSNVGNAIVVGSYRADSRSSGVPRRITVRCLSAADSADNAIYLSSAEHCKIIEPLIDSCNSSGLRIQGNHIELDGGQFLNCGNGISVQGLTTSPVGSSMYGGEGAILRNFQIRNARGRGVYLDDRSNSGWFTHRNQIVNGTIVGGCKGGAVYGTADSSKISALKIEEIVGDAVSLTGVSKSRPLTRLSLSKIFVNNVDGYGLRLKDVNEARVKHFRYVRGMRSRGLASLTNVRNSDFSFPDADSRAAVIHGDSGNLTFDFLSAETESRLPTGTPCDLDNGRPVSETSTETTVK